MDTSPLLPGRKGCKSLGTLRLSGSHKIPHGDASNVMRTPPSSKFASSPNTTPKMRKNTFLAEESPSQSYDYSSPSRLSQEFDSGDVGWEWGDKTSHSKNSRPQKSDEEKAKRQRNKIKRLQHKQVREDSRKNDSNKGFHKFKMEVEQLFQRSLTDEHSSKPKGSHSALAKEDDGVIEIKDSTDCSSNKTNQENADTNFVNSPIAKENQSHFCNLLDNSEIDALLLEASQSVEEHIVNTGVTENCIKKTPSKAIEIEEKNANTSDSFKAIPPKVPEMEDLIEITSDGDSVDEVLLSIREDELIQLTQSGISSTTQKGKTSFSRYNSMPPQPQERMSTSITTKSFIRHNSMPSDNAQNSSGLGTGTGTGTGTSKSDGQKRICTKEEVQKKKLEAKKRQLLSQQRRLFVNSKNKSVVLR